jgi:hypothetical protein
VIYLVLGMVYAKCELISSIEGIKYGR